MLAQLAGNPAQGQNVPATQQVVPVLAAGNPAANAAQHLGLAPPAGNHPQGQNVPTAQQVIPALLAGNPAEGHNILVQLGNDPEHPQMIGDSSSPDDGPALGQNQLKPTVQRFRLPPNCRPTG